MLKNPSVNSGDTGDAGWIPGLERSHEEEMANSTNVFLPGKSHDGGAWRVTVHRVAK